MLNVLTNRPYYGTRLYELKKGDKFRIVLSVPNPEFDRTYTFDRIDGAYSICFDESGNIDHISAYTPVVKVIENE